MTTFRLSDEQTQRAEALVAPAIGFLDGAGSPLGVSMVRRCWQEGRAEDVARHLAAFQNDDGGFAGLEVDIKSPVSNPFAARLEMQAMLLVPLETTSGMRAALQQWLVENQHEDGDWHFAPEVYQAGLAP